MQRVLLVPQVQRARAVQSARRDRQALQVQQVRLEQTVLLALPVHKVRLETMEPSVLKDQLVQLELTVR